MKSHNQISEPQLVITTPASYSVEFAHKVRARTTLGVLTTLIAQSERHLVLVVPFMQVNEGLSKEPLAGALAAALKRGVSVELASTGKGLDTLNRDRLQKAAKKYIRFFQPVANYENTSILGVHAKFCVADAKHAYVGSANLTKPGLEEHLEVGMLVQGNAAEQLHAMWKFLVAKEFFTEVF